MPFLAWELASDRSRGAALRNDPEALRALRAEHEHCRARWVDHVARAGGKTLAVDPQRGWAQLPPEGLADLHEHLDALPRTTRYAVGLGQTLPDAERALVVALRRPARLVAWDPSLADELRRALADGADREEPAEDLAKGVADLKPGRPVPDHEPTLGPREDTTDYSHLLRPEHHQQGYRLHVQDVPWKDQDRQGEMPGARHFDAVVHLNGREVGSASAVVYKNKLGVDTTSVGRGHRGKGLGVSMYQAMFAHAAHARGATEVGPAGWGTYAGPVDGRLSTSASRTHEALARRHGFQYQPRRVGDNPEGEQDGNYWHPGYALKDELPLAKSEVPAHVQEAYEHVKREIEGGGSEMNGSCLEASVRMHRHLRAQGYEARLVRRWGEGGGHWTVESGGIEYDPTIGFWSERPAGVVPGQLNTVTRPGRRTRVNERAAYDLVWGANDPCGACGDRLRPSSRSDLKAELPLTRSEREAEGLCAPLSKSDDYEAEVEGYGDNHWVQHLYHGRRPVHHVQFDLEDGDECPNPDCDMGATEEGTCQDCGGRGRLDGAVHVGGQWSEPDAQAGDGLRGLHALRQHLLRTFGPGTRVKHQPASQAGYLSMARAFGEPTFFYEDGAGEWGGTKEGRLEAIKALPRTAKVTENEFGRKQLKEPDCQVCGGTGWADQDERDYCSECDGRGRKPAPNFEVEHLLKSGGSVGWVLRKSKPTLFNYINVMGLPDLVIARYPVGRPWKHVLKALRGVTGHFSNGRRPLGVSRLWVEGVDDDAERAYTDNKAYERFHIFDWNEAGQTFKHVRAGRKPTTAEAVHLGEAEKHRSSCGDESCKGCVGKAEDHPTGAVAVERAGIVRGLVEQFRRRPQTPGVRSQLRHWQGEAEELEDGAEKREANPALGSSVPAGQRCRGTGATDERTSAAPRGRRPAGSRPNSDDVGGDGALLNKAERHPLHQALVDDAGLTDSLDEAGYVLPNGELVDFTGRSQMPSEYRRQGDRFVLAARGLSRDYLAGQRGRDHRELPEQLLAQLPVDPAEGPSWYKGMLHLMNTGAVRNQPGAGFSCSRMPTDAQLRVLVGQHRRNHPGDPLDVDVDDGRGNTVATHQHDRPTFERVKSRLQRHFGA